MPYKNHWLTGFVAGLILPALSFILFRLIFTDVVLFNKPAILYLVAIGLNLFILRVCLKKSADQTAMGVMIATFAFLLYIMLVLKVRL